MWTLPWTLHHHQRFNCWCQPMPFLMRYCQRGSYRGLKGGDCCSHLGCVGDISSQGRGGFATHSWWNSCLEGSSFGVPMLGWSLKAERHLYVFEMTAEMVWHWNRDLLTGMEDLWARMRWRGGLKCLMEDNEERSWVRAISSRWKGHAGRPFRKLDHRLLLQCASR